MPKYFQAEGDFSEKSYLERMAKPKMPWYWLDSPWAKVKSAGYWYLDPAGSFVKNFKKDRSKLYLAHAVFDFFYKVPNDQTARSRFYAERLGQSIDAAATPKLSEVTTNLRKRLPY